MYQTSSHDNDHHNLLIFHHNFPLKQKFFLKLKENNYHYNIFLSLQLFFLISYLSIKRGKILRINIIKKIITACSWSPKFKFPPRMVHILGNTSLETNESWIQV